MSAPELSDEHAVIRVPRYLGARQAIQDHHRLAHSRQRAIPSVIRRPLSRQLDVVENEKEVKRVPGSVGTRETVQASARGFHIDLAGGDKHVKAGLEWAEQVSARARPPGRLAMGRPSPTAAAQRRSTWTPDQRENGPAEKW